jgi:hypothetical protein
MLGLGQDTSLGNVVGPRATHFTGYCWFVRDFGKHTLYIIVDLIWSPQQWTFNNLNYNSRKAIFRISAETAEAILPQSDNLIFTNLRLPPNSSLQAITVPSINGVLN